MTEASREFNLSSLNPARCAHLIIDVQDRFCASRRENSTPVATHIDEVIAPAMRGLGVKNIWIWMNGHNEKHPDFFIATPQPSEICLRKSSSDAFHKTALDQILQREKIDTIILSGFHYGGCVLSTAEGGLAKKFHAVIMPDCTNYHADYHGHAPGDWYEYVGKQGIAQASSGEILKALLAGHKNGGKLAFTP